MEADSVGHGLGAGVGRCGVCSTSEPAAVAVRHHRVHRGSHPGSRSGTTPASRRLYGGTLTVNGIKMIVPNNSIIQMPATSMTWADLFDPAISASVGYTPPRPNHRPGVTGLALADNLVNPLAGTRAGATVGSAAGLGPTPPMRCR